MIGRGGNGARALQGALQDLMWERAGVVRDEPGLRTGLERVVELRTSVEDVEVRGGTVGVADLARALDLRAGVETAEATLRGAIERAETRGCHNRSDFPDLDPGLRVNLRVSREPSTGRLAVDPRPVPPIPAELSAWASAEQVVPAGEQLLE